MNTTQAIDPQQRVYVIVIKRNGELNQYHVTAPNVEQALKFANFDMRAHGTCDSQVMLLYSEPVRQATDTTQYQYFMSLFLAAKNTVSQSAVIATDAVSALKQGGFDITVQGKVTVQVLALYREPVSCPTIINTSKEAPNATDTQTA